MSDILANAVSTSHPLSRSLLFAPGSDERKARRAFQAGADAVIVDLEDAVAPEQKVDARCALREILSDVPAGPARMVRINGADTPEFAADAAAVAELDLDAVVLPKATPEAVAALGPDGPPVIAIIETAAGLRASYETAHAARVSRLLLGGADLGAELGLEPRADGQELLFARSQVVLDSAAAGLQPPIDVVHLAIRDPQALAAEAQLARSLGFAGKACIHPAQIEIVNRVFSPTPEQVEWAQAVSAAFERADRAGAVVVAGKLVDLPVYRRAVAVLEQASR